jgi:hypothetical protein
MTETMMVGTNGGKDYRIVDEREGLALGIKVVVEPALTPNGPGIAMGVRVRVAGSPNSTVTVANVGAMVAKVYPDIKFQKSDAERASMMIGTMAAGLPESEAKLISTLEEADFFHSVVDTMVEATPGITFEGGAEALYGYFKDTFLDTVKKELGPAFPPAKKSTGDKVVPFKPKDPS